MEDASDVFVIGGGPTGLATAIAARLKGLRVVVADGRIPPLDKACGEGMLPDGLPAARQLGLELEGYPIRGIRFHAENTRVAADFPQGPGLGVRRIKLHEAMVARAESLGVEMRWGAPVSSLENINARWIVGADGTTSRVRTLAGLNATRGTLNRFGFRQHFHVAPWTNYVEIHWGRRCQIYVTPVAENEVGLALISRDPKLRVAQALTQFPELQARLAGAEPASPERGAITGNRRLLRIAHGNIALVGDASGMVDAITGEGLGLGFHQALALADALEQSDLSRYQRAHTTLSRRPRLMAQLLLTLDRWPSLRKIAIPAMASHPQVFQGLLAVHVGAITS